MHKSLIPQTLLAVTLLLLAGCATPTVTEIQPTPEIFVASATPLKVDGAKHDIVSFAKVLIQLQPGAPFGRVVLNGMPKHDVPFNGEGVSEASVNYNLLALEELRSAGYRVLGGESLLFAQDEAAKARYTVGGTIKKLFFVVYGDFWWGIRNNAPTELGLDVEWQVYDTRSRKIAYTVTTRGYRKETGTFAQSMQGAFRESFRALLALQAFSDAVSINKSPAEKDQFEAMQLNVPAKTALALPADMNKALTSVFTIHAGATHGTGFFVTANGYALTAAHVVSGLETVTIKLSSGIELEAKVVRSSPAADTALLKVQGTGFAALSLGENAPGAGTDVFVLGTPLSDELAKSVSRGVVSGTRKVGDEELIQTDAAVNPGNSGGPMLNAQGEVMGVVSQKLAGVGVEGLAFAIPMARVKSSLNLTLSAQQ